MSTPPVSARTIVRDAVIDVLNTRRDKTSVRVTNFNISKKYLNQPTDKSNTYCVIVGDESPDGRTMNSETWTMTLKIVCWANDANDPHAIIDAMIEDVQDVMRLVRSALTGVVSDIMPGEIAPDERTVEALPWGQAVRTWTMSHERQ